MLFPHFTGEHLKFHNQDNKAKPERGKSGRSSLEFDAMVHAINHHLIAQLVNNLPAMWETWVRSLGWEDPLEKGKATHSSIVAWRIPWTVYSTGSQRVGHD